jgi:hypothetical protein
VQLVIANKAFAVPTLLKCIITGNYIEVHIKEALEEDALEVGERQSYRQMPKN